MKSAWTPERRARQAALIRTWRPWEKSTGPRTAEGRARSAANADKGGKWKAECDNLRALKLAVKELLKEQRDLLARMMD